jgi:hypothetical protein
MDEMAFMVAAIGTKVTNGSKGKGMSMSGRPGPWSRIAWL